MPEPQFNTLLIDGSNLLEVCSSADKTLSNITGKQIGGIFQFLLQLKLLLKKANFKYVYVFWDGDNSGELRFKLNPDYKKNRDKDFTISNGEMSEYWRNYEDKLKSMMNYFKRKNGEFNNDKKEERRKDKDIFFWQRDIIIRCLDELFIRQVLCDKVEADDLVGYYVKNKKPNERIVIVSNDRDLSQLISDDVILYIQKNKTFVTTKNCSDELGIHHKNILLKKILCGDTSDSIKGIKGLGDKTLMDNFPELRTREVTLEEVKSKAQSLINERLENKQKPLKWCENIVNGVTDGLQMGDVYEVNDKIINLRNPLMTEESIELMDGLMYQTLDPEDRTMPNLYNIIREVGIDELLDPNKFSGFFIEFSYYSDRERKHQV